MEIRKLRADEIDCRIGQIKKTAADCRSCFTRTHAAT